MKKYMIIIFIFLAGFIFAGANASDCDISLPAGVKIQGNTNVANGSEFLDFENNIITQNIKSYKNPTEIQNSGNANNFKTVSFENNNRLAFEKQEAFINCTNTQQKFKNIKFRIHPRAP